jgi:SAM-dependent methyltransferase
VQAGPEGAYWDAVADRLPGDTPLWRRHSDAVNARLLARWLPAGRCERLLKTDLFDEVAGDGLLPVLRPRAREVIGIDVSPRLVEAARSRHPGLTAAVADVRRLPLPDDSVDVVVSNSTLDHFASLDDVGTALAELRRVLRPGGRLIVTLDNPVNPVVGLRNALPGGLARRAGIVPYVVGATCGALRLARLVAGSGVRVVGVEHAMHFPRVVMVLAGRLLAGRPRAAERLLRVALAAEVLRRAPTAELTGHFSVVVAVAPAPGQWPAGSST